MKRLMICLAALVSDPGLSEELNSQHRYANVSYLEAAAWKATRAPDARFVYGKTSAPQYADLRLPSNRPTPPDGFPTIVFIHGGAWHSDWSKNYTEAFVEALTQQGFATWDLEYRRIGHRGGGYPGTFEDVADAADHLRVIAKSQPLDLNRVIAVGHSSGGHLALWLAGRHGLSESSTLYRKDPLALKGVISIAGVNDLELSFELGGRKDVLTLIGVDSLADGEQRFKETNPGRLLPFGIPQMLIIGDEDSQWRMDMTRRYKESAKRSGDAVGFTIFNGANHMDIVDAGSGIAESVARLAREMLQR